MTTPTTNERRKTPEPQDSVRIAAVGDLHCSKTTADRLRPIFSDISAQADVLLLCGDLTDWGLPEEAHLLVKEMAPALKMPVLAVLGNHDFESGKQDEIRAILRDAGIHVLDGEAIEIQEVGFVGVKGFGGGFGQRALQPWGETSIKRFVQEAVDESVKLESALAKLRVPQRVALLHYSPHVSTVQGEPPEIYPFLGSSRLEEPLNRYNVQTIFHGHAHYGTLEGKTQQGAVVFNVAMPLLQRHFPERAPFRIVHLAKTTAPSPV
jgi:Icc-related predicted phosphoesterase